MSPTSSQQNLVSKMRIQNEFTGHSSDNQLRFIIAQIYHNHQNTLLVPLKRNLNTKECKQSEQKKRSLQIIHQKLVFYEVYTTLLLTETLPAQARRGV